VALLDRRGVIVWVNRAWREFAVANGGGPDGAGLGTSYLAACSADPDDRGAQQVAVAIRSALAGDLPAPARVRIACDSPHQHRWFDVLTASRLDDGGRCVGAVVTLSPVAAPQPDVAPQPSSDAARSRWTSASNELTQHLLAGTDEPPLDLVLQYAMQGADADLAFISTPLGDDQGCIRAATGAMAHLRHQVVDLRGSLCGEVIRSGQAVMVDLMGDVPPSRVSDLPPGVVAAMGVPLRIADEPSGSLSVARRGTGPAYDDVDRDLLAGFASWAGLALRLDRARTEHELLRRVEDHDRIAADLHERVIQQLFATGIGMQGMLDDLAAAPRLRQRLLGYVDDLDETIGQIRATVFPRQDVRR